MGVVMYQGEVSKYGGEYPCAGRLNSSTRHTASGRRTGGCPAQRSILVLVTRLSLSSSGAGFYGLHGDVQVVV